MSIFQLSYRNKSIGQDFFLALILFNLGKSFVKTLTLGIPGTASFLELAWMICSVKSLNCLIFEEISSAGFSLY